MDLNILFIYLFIYSVLGWACETVYCAICEKRLSNRGFLIGPYCPIYGFGGMIVIIFLSKFIENPLVIFLMGMLLSTILEYITSYIMEKLFNARWWDYSQIKFNINGRICLLNSFEFGILGLIVTYIIHPRIELFVAFIPSNVIYIIPWILSLLLILDMTFTLKTFTDLKQKLVNFQKLANSMREKRTDRSLDSDIFKQLEDIRKNIVTKKNTLQSRMINAFPTLKINKLNQQLSEIRMELQKRIEKKEKQK